MFRLLTAKIQNPFIAYYKLVSICILFVFIVSGWGYFSKFETFELSEKTQTILQNDKRTLDTSNFLSETVHNETWLAFVFSCDDIYSEKNLSKYFQFCKKISLTKWYSGQLGLENIWVPKVLEQDEIKPRFDFLIPSSIYNNNDWDEIRRLSLETAYIKNVVVAQDFSAATLLVKFNIQANDNLIQKQFLSEIDECVRSVETKDFVIYEIGLPVLQVEIQKGLFNNLFLKGSLALILITLCLIFICRRFLYFGNLSLTILMSCLGLFFLIKIFDVSFDYYLLLLIPIVITVMLTFLVHLYTVMQKWENNPELSKVEIAEKTFDEILRPSLSSCLTTVAGLFSFIMSPIPELKAFGALGGLATLLVLMISLGPSFSLLLFFYHQKPMLHKVSYEKTSTFFTQFKFTLPIVSLLVLAFIFSLFYLKNIRADERLLQYLPANSSMQKGLTTLSERFGGIHLFQLEIGSAKENGVNDRAYLDFLLQIHKIAEKEPKVSAVYSYAQLISQVNDKFIEAMSHSKLSVLWNFIGDRNDKIGELQVPNAITLRTIIAVLQNFNPHGLEILLNKERSKSSLFIRTVDMPSYEYVELIQKIVKDAEKIKPKEFNLLLTEGLHNFIEKEELIQSSLIQSFLSSILPIFFIMVVFFKSFKYALIALVTNMVAIGITLGFVGYFGISLNSITVLAGAIAFGVAVDDSIHLITHYLNLSKVMSSREALEQTYIKKERAVIGTSLLVIFTATFFWLLDFKPISNFGLVTVFAMTTALLYNLFVLPLILKFLPCKKTCTIDKDTLQSKR